MSIYHWIAIAIAIAIAVLSIIGEIREQRKRQRELKALFDKLGEEKYRESVRRILLEQMVDAWVPRERR